MAAVSAPLLVRRGLCGEGVLQGASSPRFRGMGAINMSLQTIRNELLGAGVFKTFNVGLWGIRLIQLAA